MSNCKFKYNLCLLCHSPHWMQLCVEGDVFWANKQQDLSLQWLLKLFLSNVISKLGKVSFCCLTLKGEGKKKNVGKKKKNQGIFTCRTNTEGPLLRPYFFFYWKKGNTQSCLVNSTLIRVSRFFKYNKCFTVFSISIYQFFFFWEKLHTCDDRSNLVDQQLFGQETSLQ